MTDLNYALHGLQRQYDHGHERHDEDRGANRFASSELGPEQHAGERQQNEAAGDRIRKQDPADAGSFGAMQAFKSAYQTLIAAFDADKGCYLST